MFFVDRNIIEKQLIFIEERIQLFEDESDWHSPLKQAALERIVHTTLEAILDAANGIIDGFIMRDPGSYEDIIDILEDEKVIEAELAVVLKKLIPFRNILVQEYTEINGENLGNIWEKNLAFIKLFPKRVRIYLQTELGPVSAFRN
ncbi:DUF86 domain-containing protein [Bacillaceae bacterium Marseille-Q3522]|nr:DUF86 domain-containing protein [Bacillaceae bacterium Marseille-Q3522]